MDTSTTALFIMSTTQMSVAAESAKVAQKASCRASMEGYAHANDAQKVREYRDQAEAEAMRTNQLLAECMNGHAIFKGEDGSEVGCMKAEINGGMK